MLEDLLLSEDLSAKDFKDSLTDGRILAIGSILTARNIELLIVLDTRLSVTVWLFRFGDGLPEGLLLSMRVM